MSSRIVPTLVLLILSAAAPAAEIRLKPQCTATRAVITLGDLAEIVGSDDAEVARLAATELAPAPAPGQQRFFRIREIQDALWARGVNLAAHELSGYGQTVVSRPAEALPKPEKPAPKPKARPEADEEPKQISQVSVVVPVRPLPQGAVIRPEDVQMTSAPRLKGHREMFCSVEEVVGREATRPLAEGRPLDRDALRSQILVRRGDVIMLFACAPGLKVKVVARSREEGARDQQVQVETLPDRKVMLARVTGFKEAEVSPSQPVASSDQPARPELARNAIGQRSGRSR